MSLVKSIIAVIESGTSKPLVIKLTTYYLFYYQPINQINILYYSVKLRVSSIQNSNKSSYIGFFYFFNRLLYGSCLFGLGTDFRVLIMERRLERRILRDGQNPFELPNYEFMGSFRLNQQLVINIINSLRPSLQHKRTSGLSPEIQVSKYYVQYLLPKFKYICLGISLSVLLCTRELSKRIRW